MDRPYTTRLERLHIGRKARRRARRKQLMRTFGVLGLLAALLGLPGSTFSFDLLDRVVASRAPATETARMTGSDSVANSMKFRHGVFKVRPTPTPTEEAEPAEESSTAEAAAAPAPAAGGSITEIIYAAAAEFGLEGNYLLSVASCESGLDPGAVNPAGYHGLFQFDQTTWAAYGYGSIYDPTAQARTAARLLAAGHASRWPNCA